MNGRRESECTVGSHEETAKSDLLIKTHTRRGSETRKLGMIPIGIW